MCLLLSCSFDSLSAPFLLLALLLVCLLLILLAVVALVMAVTSLRWYPFSLCHRPSSKKNCVRHSVKDHHKRKSHHESHYATQDRQQQGILYKIRAEWICKPWVISDNDLICKESVINPQVLKLETTFVESLRKYFSVLLVKHTYSIYAI